MHKVFIILTLVLLAVSVVAAEQPATTAQPASTTKDVLKPAATSNNDSAMFPDIPKNHWAYDAVKQLKDAGILLGYPDGTFNGNKAMTRQDFAVAISRVLPLIQGMATGTSIVDIRRQVDDLKVRVGAIDGGQPAAASPAAAPPAAPVSSAPSPAPAAKPDLNDLATMSDLSKYADKSVVDALRRLIEEFGNELKRMRVDVDALKQDVSALDSRVQAAEKESKVWN